MSEIQKIDPRVARTRTLLQNALIDLLQEKSLVKIQVKEISEKAGVSRHAFYSHFNSKEELLFSHLDDVFAEIHQAVFENPEIESLSAELFVITSFKQWEKHVDALKWVMQVEDKDMLIARVRYHILTLMNKFAEHPHTSVIKHPQQEFDYVVDFLTGGMYMMMRRWIKEGLEKSPDQIGRLAYQLMRGYTIIQE